MEYGTVYTIVLLSHHALSPSLATYPSCGSFEDASEAAF